RLRDDGVPGRLPQQQVAVAQRAAADRGTERPDLSVAVPAWPGCAVAAGGGRSVAPLAEEDERLPVGGPGHIWDRELLARPVQPALPLHLQTRPQIDHDDHVGVARAEAGHGVAGVDGEREPRAIRRNGQVPHVCRPPGWLLISPPLTILSGVAAPEAVR